MGRYFALTLQLPAEAGAKTPKQKLRFATGQVKKNMIKFIARRLGMLIFALLLLFGALYLWEVNTTSTRGYEIAALEKQLAGLSEQNKQLELEAARRQSAQNIEEQARALGLVPSAGVNYVKDEGYALKQ